MSQNDASQNLWTDSQNRLHRVLSTDEDLIMNPIRHLRGIHGAESSGYQGAWLSGILSSQQRGCFSLVASFEKFGKTTHENNVMLDSHSTRTLTYKRPITNNPPRSFSSSSFTQELGLTCSQAGHVRMSGKEPHFKASQSRGRCRRRLGSRAAALPTAEHPAQRAEAAGGLW